jgi:hypothetical protein
VIRLYCGKARPIRTQLPHRSKLLLTIKIPIRDRVKLVGTNVQFGKDMTSPSKGGECALDVNVELDEAGSALVIPHIS